MVLMRPEYEEPQVQSSTPLNLLRQHLEDARTRGEEFGYCWPSAVTTALTTVRSKRERLEWKWTLERTRTVWQRCFERQPATAAEVALVNARVLLEREPMPDVSCEQCGGPLGDDPIGHKYCSRDCSREASAVVSIAPFGTRRGPMRQPQLPLAA
jgi:hypothetical protein